MEPYEGGASAECALCGGEIYQGEAYYYINGQALCRDCLADYAERMLAPFLVKEERQWDAAERGRPT